MKEHNSPITISCVHFFSKKGLVNIRNSSITKESLVCGCQVLYAYSPITIPSVRCSREGGLLVEHPAGRHGGGSRGISFTRVAVTWSTRG